MKKIIYSCLILSIFLCATFSDKDEATICNATSDNISFTSGRIIDVASGYYHVLALDQDNNLWAWGRNNKGQLGNDTTTNSNTPIQIFKGHKFRKIAAGNNISAAIDFNGHVYQWGNNVLVPTKLNDNIYKDVVIHGDIVALMLNSSSDIAFGSYTLNADNNPIVQTRFDTLNIPIATTSSTYSSSSTSLSHSYTYKYGTKTETYGSSDNPIVQVAGHSYFGSKTKTEGGYSTVSYYYRTVENSFFVVLSDGSVQYINDCTYSNTSYKDNQHHFNDIDISSLNNIVSVNVGHNDEAGSSTACFINSTGQLYFVGLNTNFNLFGGETTLTTSYATTPIMLSSATKYVKASIGYNHVVALSDSGKVYTWGNNTYSQLGTGDNEHRTVPTLLGDINNRTIYSFAVTQNQEFNGSLDQYGGQTYSVVDVPNKGTLDIDSSTGQFSYVPYADAYGEDGASFSIDFGGLVKIYQLNIKINRTPIFIGGTNNVNVECGNSFDGNAPAIDLDNDTLTYSVHIQPEKGYVVLDNQGNFTFTARTDKAGLDSFVIEVSDGNASALFPVNVRVNSIITYDDVTNIEIDLNKTHSYSGCINASDLDEDILTYSIVTDGTKGIVTLDDQGNYTYTVKEGMYGEDSFVLRVDDGYLPIDIHYFVNIYQVNDDNTTLFYKISKGNTFNGQIKTVCLGASATYSVSELPLKGNVVINQETGAYTYTPLMNTIGEDQFTILVDYGYDQYTLTITIYQNSAPISTGLNLNISVNENSFYQGNANCVDIDNDTLTYCLSVAPNNGIISLNEQSGEFIYYPSNSYAGNDSFIIEVSDGIDAIDLLYNVHVESEIQVVSSIDFNISQNSTLNASLIATDKDGDILTYSIYNSPNHGISNIDSASGNYIYIPDSGYFGSDSFIIKVDDAVCPKYVTINIHINQKPTVPNSIINLVANKETVVASFDVVDLDGDKLTYNLVQNPSKGSVIIDEENGMFAYTPNPNAYGDDTFVVCVSDAIDNVSITVKIHNETEIVVPSLNISHIVDKNGMINGNVNATDLDGDTLTYSIFTQPSKGSVSINNSGEYSYIANLGVGNDVFIVSISDGTHVVKVTISVHIKSKPYFLNNSIDIVVPEKGSVTTSIGAFDDDGDSLIYNVSTNPTHGQVSLNVQTGEFTYSINSGTLNDSFVVDASDGENHAYITVNVVVNHSPSVEDMTIYVPQGGNSSDTISATDNENDLLSYSIAIDGEHGKATIDSSKGIFQYSVLSKDYRGIDYFTVAITDGYSTSFAKVKVIVKPNSSPIISDQTVKVNAGEKITGIIEYEDADGDKLLFSIANQCEKGVAYINENTGEYTYYANKESSGYDYFIINAYDGFNNVQVKVEVEINYIAPKSDSWITPTIISLSVVSGLSLGTIAFVLIKFRKKIFVK